MTSPSGPAGRRAKAGSLQSVAGQRDAHLALAVAAHTVCVIWEESSKTSTPWQQSDTLLPLTSHELE